MPPKKKQKAPAAKVGLARQHLTDNFATLSCVGEDILNGHVLFVYTEHDRVISRTHSFEGCCSWGSFIL